MNDNNKGSGIYNRILELDDVMNNEWMNECVYFHQAGGDNNYIIQHVGREAA